MKAILVKSGIGVLALLLSFAALTPAFSESSDKDKLALEGYRVVREALEEFFEARGEYPLRLDELKSQGFLDEFPENPYVSGRTMNQVRTLEFASGMLVYHPFSMNGEKIDSYFLGVYGGTERLKWKYYPEQGEFFNPPYLAILYDLQDDPLAKALLRYEFSLAEGSIEDLKKRENRKKIWALPEAVVDNLDEKMKSIAHHFQIAVERYYVDNEEYPPSIETLLSLGYIEKYPQNPYYLIDDEAKMLVSPSDLEAGVRAGNIVYHAFSIDGVNLTDYFLAPIGMHGSDTKDYFYGEPKWDNFYEVLPADTKKDGHPERFLLMLANGSDDHWQEIKNKLRENPAIILHDYAWLSANPDNRAKSKLHEIQLALERYAADNDGLYPQELEIIQEQGYIYPPLNPYKDVVPDAPERMWQVKPGEFVPGGIVYLPFTMPGKEGGLVGYELALMGAKKDGGMDVGAETPEGWKMRWYYLEKVKEIPKGFTDKTDGIPDGIIMVLSSGPEELYEGAEDEDSCADGT